MSTFHYEVLRLPVEEGDDYPCPRHGVTEDTVVLGEHDSIASERLVHYDGWPYIEVVVRRHEDDQCRPAPEPGRWVIQVAVPSDVPGRDALFTAVADAATDWEPEDRDGWDIDVSAGPEADMREADQ